MKLGIGAMSFGPKARVNLDLIKRAEELGFDCAWTAVDAVHLVGPADRIRDRLGARKDARAAGLVNEMNIGTPQPEALEILAKELL